LVLIIGVSRLDAGYAQRVVQQGVLTSGMEIPQKSSRIIVIAALAAAMGLPPCAAQNAAPPTSPTILDRLNAMMAGGKSAWTPDQLAVMERLRDAAVNDPYALNQLRHLTDNIGPRISGSPQAGQAVEYVAAQMRALVDGSNIAGTLDTGIGRGSQKHIQHPLAHGR